MNIALHHNHPAWIEINIAQFKHNLITIRNYLAPGKKFCLPVKSNAYGHGLIPMSRAAVEVGIDYLGVSCLQEGKLLRQANISSPILVFGAIHLEQIAELIEYDLEFTIASHFKARIVADACNKLQKTVKVHLEIDTGMQRTGVQLATAHETLAYLYSQECFTVKGVYSHLATADDPEHEFAKFQFNAFTSFLRTHNLLNNPEVICHLANSSGFACMPETHLDMVRPGLMSFGYLMRKDIPEELRTIKPCLAIKSKVAYFKRVPGNTGISYNHTYSTKEQSHILTIPIGYGDGLRRCLSNKGSVLLSGKRYKMVGNICMDQSMININNDSGYVGDIVTVIGRDANEEITIEEMSLLCDTIPYEILCGFNDRLPRHYHT